MARMRCKQCIWLDFNCLENRYQKRPYHVCGLHGMCTVDIEGEQVDLDSRGGCGYVKKNEPRQLSLF